VKIVTFGIGGYCENCSENHDHPFNNIVEITEVDLTTDDELNIALETSNPDDVK